MKLTIQAILGFLFVFSASAFADRLECSGLSFTHGDGSADILHVAAEIVDNEILQGVQIYLEHEGKNHEIMTLPGYVFALHDSHSRAELLVGLTKFDFASDKKDVYELYLPRDFDATINLKFVGFFRTAFDRERPHLIRLICGGE